jgi:uncharacterized protein (TIGR02996 family)
MHEEEAFLQAIQERPEDTDLRLVFADWLEERGNPRAELPMPVLRRWLSAGSCFCFSFVEE